MPARPALFPEPPREQPALSRGLAACTWRLGLGEKAKWVDLKVKTIDCQECALLQHETAGQYGPRRQAKRRRSIPDGPRLDLCRAHAQAWEARDAKDSNPKGSA